MNYRMFLGKIEREYTDKIASVSLRTESSMFSTGKKEEEILRTSIGVFKTWMLKEIESTMLTGSNNESLTATDYIEYAALQTEAVPPFRPLHPRLVKALNLFTLDELSSCFSDEFISNFENFLHEQKGFNR